MLRETQCDYYYQSGMNEPQLIIKYLYEINYIFLLNYYKNEYFNSSCLICRQANETSEHNTCGNC